MTICIRYAEEENIELFDRATFMQMGPLVHSPITSKCIKNQTEIFQCIVFIRVSPYVITLQNQINKSNFKYKLNIMAYEVVGSRWSSLDISKGSVSSELGILKLERAKPQLRLE